MTNEAEVKKLGARILAADNDKFGLRTDGNGNVIIPQGSSVMGEMLKLKQKYIAMADSNHNTQENTYTPTNIASMQAASVKKIFVEWNTKEHSEYLAEMKMPASTFNAPYADYLKSLRNV